MASRYRRQDSGPREQRREEPSRRRSRHHHRSGRASTDDGRHVSRPSHTTRRDKSHKNVAGHRHHHHHRHPARSSLESQDQGERSKHVDSGAPATGDGAADGRKVEEASEANEGKRGTIIIHVCDENRKVNRDFACRRDLLLSEMRYFRNYLGGKDTCDDVDISVHCDVHIFEWLMKYIHNRDSSPPLGMCLSGVSGVSGLASVVSLWCQLCPCARVPVRACVHVCMCAETVVTVHRCGRSSSMCYRGEVCRVHPHFVQLSGNAAAGGRVFGLPQGTVQRHREAPH